MLQAKIKNLMPNLEDWKRSAGPIARGSVLGFFLGILPGGGAVISSFLSYTIEKKISKHPEEFGKGAIEGVAGPETANNAGAGGSFVPLLALGIPPNVVMALLLGALMIHGVTPGPLLISQHPEVFWGTIASMYIGNIMLLLLNLPLIGLWVKVLKIPYRILMPLILLFCLIGSYSLSNNIWDVVVMVIFGMAGYSLRKFEYEEAPLLLAFILGPLDRNKFSPGAHYVRRKTVHFCDKAHLGGGPDHFRPSFHHNRPFLLPESQGRHSGRIEKGGDRN